MTPRDPDKRLCGAKKRQSDGRCGQIAGWGTTHPGVGLCKLHGGSTVQRHESGMRERIESEARAILIREGATVVTDPYAELMALAGEVTKVKDVLGDKVDELRAWTHTDVASREDVKAMLSAYERALDRCHRVLVDIARLDLDARMVRLSELQGAMIRSVVDAVIDSKELGLTEDARQLARQLAGHQLRLVVAEHSDGPA